jgi:DNA-binding MarR family transcriptional regulator
VAGARAGAVKRDPAVLAWMRLARVYQKVDRASAAAMRAQGLSVGQFDVLAQVGAHPGITQQALADALLVTKGNVTQLLDRMEATGLLCRRQDGRANRVTLTDLGQRLAADAVPAQEALVAERLAALTADERRTLLHLLRKLDQALD